MQYTTKQEIFLDAVMDGQNIFLTGKAGTGKSFIVKEAIKKLRKKGKKVIALAPTRSVFEEGQLYVALSRVRTPEGLRILIN